MPSPPQPPPDNFSGRFRASEDARKVEMRRAHALACQAMLTLPNDAANLIAQKIQADALESVLALDPERDSEARIRCVVANLKHAHDVLASMRSFVDSTNRRLEEAAKKIDKE